MIWIIQKIVLPDLIVYGKYLKGAISIKQKTSNFTIQFYSCLEQEVDKALKIRE